MPSVGKRFSCDLNSSRRIDMLIKQNPDVQSSTLDGETVLLHLGTGRYYTLNSVASVIWNCCSADGHTLSNIHQTLCSRFDVASERASEDLIDLVNQLNEEGLLLVERGDT